MRSWGIHRRSNKSIQDLALTFNAIVQGWINSYGRFYKSELYPMLRQLNHDLEIWASQKYKRLRPHGGRAMAWLARIAHREPNLFAHWRFGLRPDGWVTGAG